VIHHEHHGGLGRHRRQAGLVGVADAHPVQQAADALAQPVADAEVEVGVERRHDLARVALDDVLHDLARHAAGLGELARRLLHLVVEYQPVDQRAPAGPLERPDLDAQPRAHLVEHLVGAAADHPAHRRQQQPVEQRPQGQHRYQQGQPQRNGDGRAHGVLHSSQGAVGGRAAGRPWSPRGPLQHDTVRPTPAAGHLGSVAVRRTGVECRVLSVECGARTVERRRRRRGRAKT